VEHPLGIMILFLTVAALLGSSLGVAVGAEDSESPGNAAEVLTQPVTEGEAPTGEVALNDTPPWTGYNVVYQGSDTGQAPSIATAGDGHLWLAFAAEGAIRVYESTDKGNTWSDVGSVSLSNYDFVNPVIAIDPTTTGSTLRMSECSPIQITISGAACTRPAPAGRGTYS